MLKKALLTISLSAVLFGCNTLKNAPQPPARIEWGFHADIEPPGWYGVHSETKERYYLPINDPRMKGAQALMAEDAKAMREYARDFEKWAIKNCKGND